MTARIRCARALAGMLAAALFPLGLAGQAAGESGVRKPSPTVRERPPSAAADSRRLGRLARDRAPDGGRATGAFLIFFLNGGDPIVVTDYVQEDGEIVFQKYGGWVRIPSYEILKIVPDDGDSRSANLPLTPPSTRHPDGVEPSLRPEPNLYLTMRGGGDFKVSGLVPEGDRVRVSVPNGSFTVPRSEILGVIRVPSAGEAPEAWLSIEAGADGPQEHGARRSAGLLPPTPEPRLPYQHSDRPHLVRLATGQVIRVDAFWVDDGEFRFRRLGGVVGIAMHEIRRVFPDDMAPVHGRTPVRFTRRIGPDLFEVAVRSGYHRVRLTGVAPVDADRPNESSPWGQLERGTIVYLEFDRQRYDADGNWLAYVFLANGRMLNAELIREGLAKPASDGRNIRYVDLLHEIVDRPPATGSPESE